MKMYCTNCGAEVAEGDKFCTRCGSPILSGAVNVTGAGTEQNVSGGQAVGFNPVYYAGAAPVAPKKSKVWPVVAIVLAVLLVISAGIGITIRKVYDKVREKLDYTENVIDSDDLEDIEDIIGDIYEMDGFNEDFQNLPGGFGSLEDELTEELEEHFGSDLDGESFNYEYAYATYFDDYVFISGNNVITDSSLVYGGSSKTVGDFCDYIDSEVMAEGSRLDRELLYDLLELHLVDPSLSGDKAEYFEQSMMYCLSFASEFSSMDMDVDYCMYSSDEPTTYYYGVKVSGKEDTWVVDYSQQFVYMNGGNTEYNSAGDYGMFEDDTLSMWLYVIDEFYGID